MKIACFGDQHWSSSRPVNRKDEDYWQTVVGKLRQELDLAVESGCRGAIFPGDLFDNARVPLNVVYDIITTIREYTDTSFYEFYICAVAGQHDQRYHTQDLKNTPLGVLSAAVNNFFIVGSDPVVISDEHGTAYIYGAGWGQPIPKPVATRPEHIHILATHRMIISNGEKLWAEQTEFDNAEDLLSAGFHLIVSGDNHKSFKVSNIRNRHLVNCGSLLRTSVAQAEHRPIMYVYDTTTKTLQEHFIQIRKDVLDTETHEQSKQVDKRMEAFVASLKSDVRTDLDFAESLRVYMRDNNIDRSVVDCVMKAIPELRRD